MKFATKNLVREKYLKYQQVPNRDPPRYEHLWGPRAYAETTKMKVLEFLTKISQSHPTCFPPLFEKALRNETEKARAAARAGWHCCHGQCKVQCHSSSSSHT